MYPPPSYEEAQAAQPLHLLDKTQWREVARYLRPDITDDQFEEMWGQFHRDMARRKAH